jgi:hypothetical protein
MVKLIDLYDARLTNQFLKLLHEVERLQRLRKDDDGAVAPENKGLSSGNSDARENATTPPAASADQSASPVAQPPSVVVRSVPVRASEEAPDGATTSAHAEVPVPHTLEQSQVVAAEEAEAPMAV